MFFFDLAKTANNILSSHLSYKWIKLPQLFHQTKPFHPWLRLAQLPQLLHQLSFRPLKSGLRLVQLQFLCHQDYKKFMIIWIQMHVCFTIILMTMHREWVYLRRWPMWERKNARKGYDFIDLFIICFVCIHHQIFTLTV